MVTMHLLPGNNLIKYFVMMNVRGVDVELLVPDIICVMCEM